MIQISEALYAELTAVQAHFNALMSAIVPVVVIETKSDAKLKKDKLKWKCAVEQSKHLGGDGFLKYIRI